jgi:hypothetical protein
VIFVFEGGPCLKIPISSSAVFVVAKQESLSTEPSLGTSILLRRHDSDVVLACINGSNNLSCTPNLSWNPLLGPDLLLEKAAFAANLDNMLRKEAEYFQNATLFEVLLNQTLFNGFGTCLANEVLQRLYFHFRKPEERMVTGEP